jgi:hypothetical protein
LLRESANETNEIGAAKMAEAQRAASEPTFKELPYIVDVEPTSRFCKPAGPLQIYGKVPHGYIDGRKDGGRWVRQFPAASKHSQQVPQTGLNMMYVPKVAFHFASSNKSCNRRLANKQFALPGMM